MTPIEYFVFKEVKFNLKKSGRDRRFNYSKKKQEIKETRKGKKNNRRIL